MDKKFEVAVKGIIRRGDGKILIVKRSREDDHAPELWETVGGGMDEEISPEENLKREICIWIDLLGWKIQTSSIAQF